LATVYETRFQRFYSLRADEPQAVCLGWYERDLWSEEEISAIQLQTWQPDFWSEEEISTIQKSAMVTRWAIFTTALRTSQWGTRMGWRPFYETRFQRFHSLRADEPRPLAHCH
jgi:hypothetical protein